MLEEVVVEPAVEPAVAGDDESSFAAFYELSFERAARLAFLLTGDPSGSEDIAQEALSRIQPGFDRIEMPSAYLRTVVVNLCKRHGADQARQRTTREQLGGPGVQDPEGRELLDVIDALPLRQKTVVVLRYYEDLTEAEIAAVLGCRPGTVKSLAARALTRIRRELDS